MYISNFASVNYMKICFVVSETDVAGMNMFEHIKDSFTVISGILTHKTDYATYELHTISGESIHAENIENRLDANLLIFLTKHASKSGIASYSTHTQGNWDTNEYGGNPQEVAPCPVVLKDLFFHEMKSFNPEYEVVQEVTHHGPSVTVPSVFVEIGSAHDQWKDPKNGEFMKNVILTVINSYVGENTDKPVYMGLGGQHTCTNYERLVSSNDIIIGHVCPTRAITSITHKTILHAVKQHTIHPTILLDWKSMKGPDKKHILAELELAGLPYVRLDHLKKEIDASKQEL